uniref:hypothetical protein n=1 Tax=Sphingobacterium sp. UBA7253 TaxID=1947517 RepID=UPI00257CFED8
WLSQHRTIGEPGPSVAVPQTVAVLQPQLSLFSVVWSILVAEGNCNPVDSTHTAFTDRVKPYCFSPVSYNHISVSTARATRNYWGISCPATILVKLYCFSSVSYCCISIGLAVATFNKQLYMLSDCWEVFR